VKANNKTKKTAEWQGDTNFRYEIGGNLVPIPATFSINDIHPDEVDKGTMMEVLKFGQEYGIHLSIVERYEDEVIRWWLILTVHPSSCCIEVNGWPAMLDALNRYAPMVNMDSTDWIRSISDQYEKKF
jgi:hypothetical protein